MLFLYFSLESLLKASKKEESAIFNKADFNQWCGIAPAFCQMLCL